MFNETFFQVDIGRKFSYVLINNKSRKKGSCSGEQIFIVLKSERESLLRKRAFT